MEETLSLFQDIFSESGLIAKSLPSFENRLGQQEMTHKIWQAFEQDKSALFEAGTGIGKSLAYLIPALLWSYKTGEKIVVSTYTISLQEQLLEKDIPFLLDALGLDLHVVLAKGMSNYVCMRKLDEVSHQGRLFDDSVDAVVSWAKKTSDGTKSSIPNYVSRDVWSKVYAESDACSYVKCPEYKSCFFFKARQKVQEADVVIVNHHLLMAHLQAGAGMGILPFFSRVIIDEAHHLENVARSSLTKALDRVELFRSLAKIHSDAHPEVSRLMNLRDAIKERENKSLDMRLGSDLPGEKRELLTKINDAFDKLDQFFLSHSQDPKWRLTKNVLQSKNWKEDIAPLFEEMKDALKRFGASLDSIEDDLPEEVREKMQNALLDIGQTSENIKETISVVDAFFGEEEGPVRWAERGKEGTVLYLAELDVSPFMKEKLFEKTKSAVLCSATLSVGGNFSHVMENIGLEDATQDIYPSPFDFQTRTKLCGFSDLPPPNSYDFIDAACEVIDQAVDAAKGGAFVLFTSYDMLNKCAERLSHLPLFVQGDLPRHQLLEEYKAQKNGILLGTDSFWEGVDVAGDALKLVIIMKLPFPVPSEPLIQARAEAMKKEGKDPFNGDSVPQAVMKFKQGFGRLMRRKTDRGCVLCLDQRLFTRSYGKAFLRSLPECITSYDVKSKIIDEMRSFYRNGA